MKININQQNVFFTSDPHYHHKQLVLGSSSWEDKNDCRKFKSLEEHDDTLVNNINNLVSKDDILFCLGDWAFGSYNGDNIYKSFEFRERINCKNIHLILGNHDQEIRDNKSNLQGIFSSVSFYKEMYIIEPSTLEGVKAEKQHICMMHYPIRSWNKMRKGSFMLHGHCHNNLPDLVIKGDLAKTMDVGVDTHKEFRPYSYEEVKEIMSKRHNLTEDHH